MIAALAFAGIALGEPVSSVVKKRGPFSSFSAPLYVWREPSGSVVRVAAKNGKIALIDLLASDEDRRWIELPFDKSEIELNESGHLDAPVSPNIFSAAPLPFTSNTDTFLAYFGPGDTALGLYFDGPGDGGVREIVFGYRDVFLPYCAPLKVK